MAHVEWLEPIAQLDCLPELDLTVGHSSTPEVIAPLVHARSLRFLLVSERDQLCLPLVMQLTQLTKLCIYKPKLDATNFLAFCSAMSGLEELWLQTWDTPLIRSIRPSELTAGLSSFVRLHTLKFNNSFDELTLAPVLHLVPALRHLFLPRFGPEHQLVLLAQLCYAAPLLEMHFAAQEDRHRLDQTLRTMVAARALRARLIAEPTEQQLERY